MKSDLVFLTFSDIVNVFLIFKTSFQKGEYTDFCESRISVSSKWIALILFGLIFLVEMTMYLKAEETRSEIMIGAVVNYCFLVGLSIEVLRPKNAGDHKTVVFQNFCEGLLLLGICFEGGLLYLANDATKIFNLTQSSNVMVVSMHDLVLLTMSPLLLSIVFHSTEWFTTFLCWLNGVGFLLYRNWTDFSVYSATSFFMYTLLSLAISYEYRRQSLAKFLLAQNLKLLIQENERMSQEFHATEMRHMIANVAHDLKTPLAGFMNGNEIVANVLTDCMEKHKRGELTVEYVHESAVTLMGCVNNMKSINNFMLMTINRCIDYTKASQGMKLVPHRETIDLREALALPLSVMKDMQSRVVVAMRPMSPEICSHVITDKQWLQENILCLLSNATKYSSGGEVQITVELLTDTILRADRKVHVTPVVKKTTSVSSDGIPTSPPLTSWSVSPTGKLSRQQAEHMFATTAEEEPLENQLLLIEVEDHGIGLSDEVMETLFNPFRQAQRMTGGTGLGLYSLAKRMDALGGFYGVLRRRDGDKGSRFWFAIPYRPDIDTANAAHLAEYHFEDAKSEPSAQSSLDVPVSKTLALDLGKATELQLSVLIVDDSVSVIKLTSMMLRRQGYLVETAENGAIAVDMVTSAVAAAKPYDVVLMDLQMPIMDGLEAMQRIRDLELAGNSAHQLIIGVSANSDNDTRCAALDAGADAFINKPFTTKTFTEMHQKLRPPPSVVASGLPSPSARGRVQSDAAALSVDSSGSVKSSMSTLTASSVLNLPAVYEVPISAADIGVLFASRAEVAPIFRSFSNKIESGLEVTVQTIRRCKTRRFAVMEVYVATEVAAFGVELE